MANHYPESNVTNAKEFLLILSQHYSVGNLDKRNKVDKVPLFETVEVNQTLFAVGNTVRNAMWMP